VILVYNNIDLSLPGIPDIPGISRDERAKIRFIRKAGGAG
jgi:hypothetical protein